MNEWITMTIDGVPVRARRDWSVAVAIWNTSAVRGVRRAVGGELRAPVCGMGVCYECCVSIDGREKARSCMVMCREGMDVRTIGGEV